MSRRAVAGAAAAAAAPGHDATPPVDLASRFRLKHARVGSEAVKEAVAFLEAQQAADRRERAVRAADEAPRDDDDEEVVRVKASFLRVREVLERVR